MLFSFSSFWEQNWEFIGAAFIGPVTAGLVLWGLMAGFPKV